ncbi:MAG: hypothetical protein A2Z17_01660 [Gammaproteobacteria bacterium RBG_16_66_13]|nr:MAG: hypothetical protein A2Z17_01660 [Gammaproteobacteria bacterium RBG_16_66_13]
MVIGDDTVELYRLNGTSAGTWAAPGIHWPRQGSVQTVGSTVYYLKPSTGAVAEVSATGTSDLSFTATAGLSAFTVSPDEGSIAWSTSTYTDQVVSQLWLAAIDGSGIHVALESDPADEIAAWFALEPVAFGTDGSLVYAWQITGIGGYILFGGHSSLYRYDPVSATTTPWAPLLSDSTGPCWNTVREDLAFAVGHCIGTDGTLAVRERNLQSGIDVAFPAFPGQGQAGAGAYSPSGQRLAYAIARGDPDAEAGQIIVRRSPDSPLAPLASITNGYFRILYWLDEDRLLVGGMEDGVEKVFLVGTDGVVTPLAEGPLAGWIHLP